MADPLGADIQRRPNALGSHGFSSVRGQSKAGVLRLFKEVAKWFGCPPTLIAADSDAHDTWRVSPQFRRLAKYSSRLFRAKVTDRVKNPIQGNPKLPLGPHAGCFHPVEKPLKLDPPP